MNPPCPHLPAVSSPLGVETTRRHAEKNAAYYADALRYAQWHWISGKPAQAVLQLNKAWMAAEPDGIHAPPYRALVWILHEAADGTRGFLGNPVRHFQHLATRMSGPRAEERKWRAWLCFHLAEEVMPGAERDGRQLAREGCWIPGRAVALGFVKKTGWPGETEFF